MLVLTTEDQALYEKLNSYPILKARVKSLLEIVENSNGDLTKAAATEQRVIDELRQMGNEVLSGWATQQVNKTQKPNVPEGEAKFVASGKKNSVGTRLLGISS